MRGQTIGSRLTPQLIADLRSQQLAGEALAEAALPAFLDAVHAVAGAILLYSMRTESLDLLAEQGLSDEGRKHLKTIRKGAGWPIPLHALINHKAYIIDRPQDHKFIPELVGRKQVPVVANLAVIPLYHEETRVGVFLAVGGRVPIKELQIMEQVAAIDALAAAIVPSRAPTLKAVPPPTLPKSAVPRPEPSPDTQSTTERQSGAHRAEIDELRAAHQRELETVRAMHEHEVAELRAALQAESDAARATYEREIAELRAAHRKELETARAEAAAALENLRTTLGDRDGTVAERDRRLAELLDERDRSRAAAFEAETEGARLRVEIERSKAELEGVKTAHQRELDAARAAQVAAAAEATSAANLLEALNQDLSTSKNEVGTLRERNGALEAQVGRLEVQVASLTSERGALVQQLAAVDVDRRSERTEQPTASPARPSVNPALPKVDPPAITADTQTLRILDADPEQQERIAATLKGKHALRDRRLVVANLFSITPEQIAELTAAMEDGATVVGYASDGKRRSCVLGPVRLFVEPPPSAEAALALPRPIAGPRRILTLSNDIDAFREVNAVLAGAGHSVSMACDARQATELVSVINPDTVTIDLRGAPAAGGQFLASLGSVAGAGRMLKVLVCGDPVVSALARAIEHLLRPVPLDAVSLGQLCVDVFREPEPSSAARPFQRTIPAPKKVGRRL